MVNLNKLKRKILAVGGHYLITSLTLDLEHLLTCNNTKHLHKYQNMMFILEHIISAQGNKFAETANYE